MKESALCGICVIIVLGVVFCEENEPLKVKFQEPKTQDIHLGENITFSCEINRISFVINISIQMIRQSEGGETKAFRKDNGKTVQEDLNVEVPPHSTSTVLYVTISNATDDDEGRYTCLIRNMSDNFTLLGEDYKDIRVLRPLDNIRLQFNDNPAISEDFIDPIEVDPGTYTVTCGANGSNPAPNVSLYYGGVEVQNVTDKTEKLETKFAKYRKTITGNVVFELSKMNSMKLLKCVAQSLLEDQHSVKLKVKINRYEPKITCNHSEANNGQEYVFLICTVEYDDLNITGFKYGLGDKNLEGEQDENFEEVSREKLSETKVRVLLKMTKAKDHFRDEFYMILKLAHGYAHRESVMSHKIAGSSGTIFPPSVVVIILMAIVSLSVEA